MFLSLFPCILKAHSCNRIFCAKMSLFYRFIHFINSSVDKSCCNSPMPLNRRMQSTYPWQYAFCPSKEFISSSFAIQSTSNCRRSCGSCRTTVSHFSRSASISSWVPCILAPLPQYPLLHSHSATGSKTVRPVPIFYSAYPCPPSNLIIIINISADITPPKNQDCHKKGNEQCSQYIRTPLIPFSHYLFYSQPLSLSGYIPVGLDHSLFSSEADGYGK